MSCWDQGSAQQELNLWTRLGPNLTVTMNYSHGKIKARGGSVPDRDRGGSKVRARPLGARQRFLLLSPSVT